MSNGRDIHIHLTAQPGTTVHVTVAGDNVTVASDQGGANANSGNTVPSGDVLEKAIARLESSGASRNVRKVADGLRDLGYKLIPAEAKAAGKQPENYLRVIDPDHSATRGVGYLAPTYLGLSRALDRDRLLRLEGADPITNTVKFSHVESAQPSLKAAKLIKS